MVKINLSSNIFLCCFIVILISFNACATRDVHRFGQRSILMDTIRFSLLCSQFRGSFATLPLHWLNYFYTHSYVPSSSTDIEQVKNRRGGGTKGLFAFPRVGRSDQSLDEMIPNSYEEYDDTPKYEIKRYGLVPFPRVGRSENLLYRKWLKLANLQNMEKRTGTQSANSGLWFGPRLGRVQKRNSDNLSDNSSNEHFI